MVDQNLAQPVDLLSRRRIEGQSKIDNPMMRDLVQEDELTKVAIVGDEDALLGMSDAQHFTVRESVGIVVGNGSYVVPFVLEKRSDLELSALIQQESHALRGLA